MPYMTENDPETRDPYENMMAMARAAIHATWIQYKQVYVDCTDQTKMIQKYIIHFIYIGHQLSNKVPCETHSSG